MLRTRKRDERTNKRPNARTNRQARSNMPPNFFQSWGHNYGKRYTFRGGNTFKIVSVSSLKERSTLKRNYLLFLLE